MDADAIPADSITRIAQAEVKREFGLGVGVNLYSNLPQRTTVRGC